MIISSIGQGLLWGVLGLGIFMTYRILNFPDMTTEGSFPLGGAVCVAAIVQGIPPIIATFLGVLAGMCAGLVTGLLYTKGKIPVILSGILVMSALNSVMLFVMQTIKSTTNFRLFYKIKSTKSLRHGFCWSHCHFLINYLSCIFF
jgi:putative ABC transport system permease protein